MKLRDLYDRGLKLRQAMYGKDMVENRMNAFGKFGEPLQDIINAHAYGNIWSRPTLSMSMKSLTVVAMLAAMGRLPELRVHIKGAIKNGVTIDEIREVFILLTLYAGIPASIEAHRIAIEVVQELDHQ
jgi:4-carboxymuconolactone decarboxylase